MPSIDAPGSARAAPSPPHPRDILVGEAVAARRKRLQVSQYELARAIGVTYQQLQKYETGKNRFSASRLWDVSIALNCDVAEFFSAQALKPPGTSRATRPVATLLKAVYGAEASQRYVSLPPSSQRAIVDLLAPLARALSEGAPVTLVEEPDTQEGPEPPFGAPQS